MPNHHLCVCLFLEFGMKRLRLAIPEVKHPRNLDDLCHEQSHQGLLGRIADTNWTFKEATATRCLSKLDAVIARITTWNWNSTLGH